MLTSHSGPTDSAMQRRFGANVDVTPTSTTDRQVFLVTGSDPHLAGVVRAGRGRQLFAGPGWILAELSFSEAMLLRGLPNVRAVCGVSIDPQRIEALKRLFGQETTQDTRQGAAHG